MRVKMLTSLVGPGLDLQHGDEAELSAGDAERLIRRNLAQPVETRPAPAGEQATRRPRETAVRKPSETR